MALRQAPGDSSRWFVVEKGGTVRTFADDLNALAWPRCSSTSQRASTRSPTKRACSAWPFIPASHPIIRFFSPTPRRRPTARPICARPCRASPPPTAARRSMPRRKRCCSSLEQPYVNHNGGNILFGPDGYLYMGFGDGGSGGDPMKNGQNTDVLFAKMLRLDVDSGSPYAIPPSNPFATAAGKKKSTPGDCCNPWRWSFDRATGGFVAGDVGQDLLPYEEVDKVELGGDYGWNVAEGLHCYDATSCDKAGMIDPVAEYDHTGAATASSAAMSGYNGAQIPSLVGTYLYSDNGSGRLYALTFDLVTEGGTPLTLAETGLSPSLFGHQKATTAEMPSICCRTAAA